MQTPRWMPVMWSGIYFILLLSLYTPFSIFTIHFIMIPGVVLLGLCGPRRFALFYGIPLVLILGMFQGAGLLALIIALFFLTPILVIGLQYRRGVSAQQTILTSTLSIIGLFLLILMGAYAFGFQAIQEIQEYMMEHYRTLPTFLKSQATDEMMDLTIALAAKMIPLFMIITGLVYTAVTHALSSRILRAVKIQAPALPPIRKWMMPKALVWYYLIALVLDLMMKKDIESILTVILINVFPLLMIAFVIQAISFLTFVAHRRKKGFFLPVLGVIMSLFLPSLVSLLGVFDVAFPIRKGVQKR